MFFNVKSHLQVGKYLFEIVLMDKEECMRSGIKGIGNFELIRCINIMINDFNDLFAEFVEVEYWWVGIKADRMKLIAVL